MSRLIDPYWVNSFPAVKAAGVRAIVRAMPMSDVYEVSVMRGDLYAVAEVTYHEWFRLGGEVAFTAAIERCIAELDAASSKPAPDYPHTCDCGAPAYRGLNKIECSDPRCTHGNRP